ncbi:MAG: AbrB/MazE/SpoVT family DNA-binding domain-containing protein, partial [Nitrospirae bacterium]|nr:AbrB/MazE/SpoVT family DNA-binding domain-containing protein [Nitrospirota bacterium]
MLAKKTSKNQLTLPKEIAKDFAETEYFDVSVKDSKIVLKPVRCVSARTSLDATR